jgi:hypothetical protein
MEIPNSQETPSDSVLDLEVFRVWMNLMQVRVESQRKCIEMSLQITTGLAGAIAAAAITKNGFTIADLSQPKVLVPIVLVFGLYGLIQTLILMNYIYHTHTLRGADFYRANLMCSLEKAFGPEKMEKQQ